MILRIVAILAAGMVVPGGSTAEGAAQTAAANPHYTGAPTVRTWLPDDYGAHPENHSVVQHPRTGLIYVGNVGCVLEFDGVRWQRIPTPANNAVLFLCIDRQGRIWGSGSSSLFRLEQDARGEWQAQSMVGRLPAEFQTLLNGREVVASEQGVYFRDAKNLMFFPSDDGAAQVWPIAEGNAVLLRLWLINDEPYVTVGAPVNKILRRHDGKFEATNLERSVLDARADPDGSWRLLTTASFQRWDGATLRTTPFPFQSLPVRQGFFLADGRCVCATQNQGLIVCDPAGRVLQQIDRSEGLPANQVTGVAVDREGGIWAALPYGISRVQLDSPYARHGPPQGLEGTVHSLVRQGDTLFAGGTEGIVRQEPDGRFRPVDGITGPEREIVAHGDWLFGLGIRLEGLRPALTNTARELENRNYYGLLPLASAPGWYVHGSNAGLRWARLTGDDWISAGSLPAIRTTSVALLEAPAGIVWASTGVLWRVDFRAGVRGNAPARRLGPKEGIPRAPAAMFVLAGEIVALTAEKLLRFEETTGRFLPEDRIAGLDNFPIEMAHRSSDGTLWLQGSAQVGREIRHVVPTGGQRSDGTKEPRPLRAEALPGEPLRHLRPTTLFHDVATQTLWIGGHGALISRDLAWRSKSPITPPIAVVRRIETAAGTLLAGGEVAAARRPLLPFDPEQDALRITFGAPTFATDHAGIVHTEYRTRIEGLEREWSAWSQQTERNLTNLPWRAFTFRVQARDDAGRIGPESSLAFSIRPAWWASAWAWVSYGVLSLLGLAGIVRLRTHTLHHRAEKLEALIARRTQELAQSNAQLAAQNAELARLHRLDLDGKISAQLAEEKARLETLRYQLNPHFLYNSLNSIYGLMFDNIKDAGAMVLRLSDFCRATLTAPSEELPALTDELAALRPYLDIEKVRWADKLEIEISVDPAVEHIRVPSFLLLPLVENAIKHGSRTSPEGIRLAIRAHALPPASHIATPAEPDVVIEIANTGTWLEPESARDDSTGIGLENLRQRLARYYPGTHEFTVEPAAGWVVVRLRLGRMLTPDQRPAPKISITAA